MQRVKATGGAVRVVYLTDGDGYPEGVKEEDHVEAPTAKDYLGYGKQRRREAHAALVRLGLGDAFQTFLGFPDGGLCKLTRVYWSERRSAYRSPYTRLNRPPKSEMLVPATQYRGEDLSQELALVIGDFKPTMIAVPRREDQHADHCAAWYFLNDSLNDVRRVHPEFTTDEINYIVHFNTWPFEDDGPQLEPPPGLRGGASGWMRLAAHAGRDPRQASGAAALHDADARDGLVSRRLRAVQRSVLAAAAVQGDPAEPPQSLLRSVDVTTAVAAPRFAGCLSRPGDCGDDPGQHARDLERRLHAARSRALERLDDDRPRLSVSALRDGRGGAVRAGAAARHAAADRTTHRPAGADPVRARPRAQRDRSGDADALGDVPDPRRAPANRHRLSRGGVAHGTRIAARADRGGRRRAGGLLGGADC